MKCSKCENVARASGLCAKCYGAKWYGENKAKVQKRKEVWYENNREVTIAKTKKWKINNPEKTKQIDKNRDKVKLVEYFNNRYKTDCEYRLRLIIRQRLRTALKQNPKKGKTLELLGCSIEFYRAYLESKWQPGMSWENHSKDGWHIDHIVPLDSFDLTDEEQLKKASHYTNTQPLWSTENLRKSNRL